MVLSRNQFGPDSQGNVSNLWERDEHADDRDQHTFYDDYGKYAEVSKTPNGRWMGSTSNEVYQSGRHWFAKGFTGTYRTKFRAQIAAQSIANAMSTSPLPGDDPTLPFGKSKESAKAAMEAVTPKKTRKGKEAPYLFINE